MPNWLQRFKPRSRARRIECEESPTNPEFSGIPPGFPLIAGEAAHQLRSALDHLVWQLVIANTGATPTGTKSGFPIFKNEKGYDKRAPSMI